MVRRVLAGLGDRRCVHRIELGPPPPGVLGHLKGWFAGARPPRDALWAYIAAPAVGGRLPLHPTARQAHDATVAFPNPSAAAFPARARLVGKRCGFRVDSLRLLRPLGLAPLLVVSTGRERTAFVKDVPATKARDADGPFVRVDDTYRGQTTGGE